MTSGFVWSGYHNDHDNFGDDYDSEFDDDYKTRWVNGTNW